MAYPQQYYYAPSMKTARTQLTEMVSEAAVIWLVSLCSLGSIVAIVFGCVCGCRKKVPKNELMGLAGMVKLTNPDGNVNFNSAVPVIQIDNDSVPTDGTNGQDYIDLNKRPSSAMATATRSLPDLPVEPGRVPGNGDALWEVIDHNDASSDLYATVEENKSDGRLGIGMLIADKRRCTGGQAGDDGYNSPTQTDDSLSPYARVKGEHPYDQLKQSEHPYAQVHANGVPAGSVQSHNNHPTLPSTSSQNIVAQERTGSPVAPPRTRKSLALSQSSLASLPGLDGCTIPAATAIAGGIPANQELPYMTPPLLNPPNNNPNDTTTNNTSQHFSGDSQDSSKGYTSISVREPLASILGERGRVNRQELMDSHYTTVSDDSDEMYAAIEEPGQAVYTSGSETYAQIRPPRPALATVEDSSEYASASVHPAQSSMRNVHSRQASSSGAASSGVSPNSPRPEKRQANSPLPRPPPELLAPGSTVAMGVDDMYAKVIKKRRSSHSISSLDHDVELQQPAMPSTAQDSLIPGYECVSVGGGITEPNYEELKPQDNLVLTNSIESSYAKVNKNRNSSMLMLSTSHVMEPDYASLSRKDSAYDPNYESVCPSGSDPNYESLEQQDDPPYEKLQSTSDDASPDYETVYKLENSDQLYSHPNKHSNPNS